jgi:TatD related DNase
MTRASRRSSHGGDGTYESSLHSAGCADKLLDILAERPHPGAILHWFLGDDDSLRRAVDFGCFFSVNGSMSKRRLAPIPADHAAGPMRGHGPLANRERAADLRSPNGI